MMKTFKLTLLVLALQFGMALPGQISLVPTVICPAEQTEFVVHLEAAVVLNPSFSILVPGADGDWGLPNPPAVGASCGTSFGAPVANNETEDIGGNVRATFTNGNNPRITINSANGLPLTAGEYRLAVRLNLSGGDLMVRNFRFIVRKPVDIVFALDRSGSMECDTDEDASADWSACSTTDTDGNGVNGDDGRRWSLLSSAIDNFVGNLDDLHTLANDRMSVVYFDGNTNTDGALVSDATPFRDIAAFRGIGGSPTPLKTELDNMIGSGNDLGRNGTSIGAGLAKAINGRYGGNEDTDRREVVLLFTDGEQNTGNWVKSSGLGTGRVIEQSSSNSSVVLNLDDAAVNDIEVLTVSTVSAGPGPGLLQNIAKEVGDFYNVLPGQEDQFGSDLAGHAFNRIFNQFSPRFVDVKQFDLTVGAGPVRLDAPMNHNVNRAIFQAYFSKPIPPRTKVRMKIYKDGVEVTRKATLRGNKYSITGLFRFYELADLTSEGIWTAEVIPARGIPANTKVNIMVTADDHAVRFDAGTVEDELIVGRSFRPTLILLEEGLPVNNAVVTATISRPGDDLGDLLARTKVRQMPRSHTESASCADLKYGVLRRENPSALKDLFRVKSNKIILASASNGRYEGVFKDANVTGVYKIRYDINYSSPGLGKVRRMVEQTRYVNFPAPDLNLMVQDVERNEKQGGNSIILAEPTYKVNGKKRRIGPGYEKAFGVSNQSVRLNTFDNCNGSYQLQVSGPPGERFTLYLLEDEVFKGTVKEFNAGGKPTPKGYLSLSGGRTLPQGDFDRRFDEGIYGQIGLGRRFGSLLGLEVVGGYYSFEPDFQILGGTAYFNAYLGGGGTTSLMVGAGPGYYFPEGGDARLGGSVRVAMERQFGRLSLGVEGGYFRLTEPEIDFATIGLRATIGL
jgi:Mg-chelatase subunit ChlD